MKKFIFLLITVIIFTNLRAQDIIILNDGTEIESKILEVGIENIKYKKFNAQEGPVYLLPKSDIFLIKYEDGTKDIFNPKESNINIYVPPTDFRRKGLYLGFHLIPGIGNMSFEGSESGFAFNSGVDFNILFNDYVGIKTGLSYLTLSYEYDSYFIDEIGNPYYAKLAESTSSIGIPIKFLLITGKKTVGFFLESGLNVYFPISSKITFEDITIDGPYESVVLSEETSIGINIKASELISLNMGLFAHYSLTSYFPEIDSYGLMLGLHSSILFKLSK